MANDGEFRFYKGLDFMYYDYGHVSNKTIAELKAICKSNKRCVGFNTKGYIKFFIGDEKEFVNLGSDKENDGLYVYIERYNEMRRKNDNKEYTSFQDYKFYPTLDSFGNDICHISNKTVQELKEIADKDLNCMGFNTLGFLKYKITSEIDFKSLNTKLYYDGLYVKNKKFRVKLLCNWCTSKELCLDWNRLSKGNFIWNDIEITWEDKDVDFYVIINKPLNNEY